jgi:hypothetical protein
MAGALFIGRLSGNIRTSDLEDAFGKFGKLDRCDMRKNHAFVSMFSVCMYVCIYVCVYVCMCACVCEFSTTVFPIHSIVLNVPFIVRTARHSISR